MTTAEKVANLGAVVVPFAATVAAIALLPGSIVGPGDLAIAAVMYVVTALGITVGYHRLLTHRSFATSKPLEYAFAALGSMAVQGPVIAWVVTTASTTPTPTARATRTAPTWATGAVSPACYAASGTHTPAGCSKTRAVPSGVGTRPTSARTAGCGG